jgi:hypothetical protein
VHNTSVNLSFSSQVVKWNLIIVTPRGEKPCAIAGVDVELSPFPIHFLCRLPAKALQKGEKREANGGRAISSLLRHHSKITTVIDDAKKLALLLEP